MSAGIVFQQMLVVFLMIGAGFFIFRKKLLSDRASKDFSTLISRVCNPALMLSSAFENTSVGRSQILLAGEVAVVLYAILLLLGKFLPILLDVDKEERKYYTMMTVYANIGFMGIPVASAVLGSESVIYLTVFIMVFNFVVYTHGIATLSSEEAEGGFQLKRAVNVGTIAACITIIVVLCHVPVHPVISDAVSYIGRCTTFISMLVLGGSIAGMNIKEIFSEKKLYLFTAIRFFLLPCVGALILKNVIHNPTILGVSVLSLSLPVANITLMLAEERNMECKLLTKGIILTTICALASVTLSVAVLTM